MPHYSPVAPVEVLLQIQERGLLDNYLLVLAHEVVEKPSQYAKLMEKFTGTIILDNSLIELGKPAPLDIMVLAAAIVRPTYVVLPDILFNKEETISLSLDAMRRWAPELPTGTKFMIAAQGDTDEEAFECVQKILYKKDPKDFLVGIPRAVANSRGTRLKLTQMLTSAGYTCHLLGMSENLTDDIYCTRMSGVLGIDSASPLRAGWEMLQFDGRTNHLKDRNDYFKQCRGLNAFMTYNLGVINGRLSF